MIWSTGAPVRRRDMAGPYVERLSLAPDAVDLSRLQGASVLDAHRQSAVRDVLGSMQSVAVDSKRGTALIRFSARPEVEPLWQDVLSGNLRHVSVGYDGTRNITMLISELENHMAEVAGLFASWDLPQDQHRVGAHAAISKLATGTCFGLTA